MKKSVEKENLPIEWEQRDATNNNFVINVVDVIIL
jgi:hypothetical protein